jgi:anti-sigma-K factor RskA
MAPANSSSATAVKMASDGVWQGENPLDFALPLLAVQIAVILAVTQGLALVLRPLRQPKVVAEILVYKSLFITSVVETYKPARVCVSNSATKYFLCP